MYHVLCTKKPPKNKPVRKDWATEKKMGTNCLPSTITKVPLAHKRLRFEQLVFKSSSGYRELVPLLPSKLYESRKAYISIVGVPASWDGRH